MKYTSNYNLNKPEGTDVVNIEDLNANMDIIDAEVGKKVDKVSGKDLSANDFTTTEKNKLAGIEVGANKYTHPTGPGNNHVPTGGVVGQVLKNTASGVGSWQNEIDTNTTYTAGAGLVLTGTVFSHLDTPGNKHIPAGGAANQILKYSAAGTAVWVAESVTPIANNLTETVAGKALDATKGKALNDDHVAHENNTTTAHGGVDANSILTKLKTVDTDTSGLNANTLQGKTGESLWTKVNKITLSVNIAKLDITIPTNFSEIRIIGRNIKPATDTTSDLAMSINNLGDGVFKRSTMKITGASVTSQGSITTGSYVSIGTRGAWNPTSPFHFDMLLENYKDSESNMIKCSSFGVGDGCIDLIDFENKVDIASIAFFVANRPGSFLATGSTFEIWGR